MAVQDITAYAHLTDGDIEEIGRRLTALEKKHRDSLGARDAGYIKGLIRTQRGLDLAARAGTVASPAIAMPAAAVLGVAKILENLEIGHNVMHGQWDWMNDPEIHSSTWEWDNTGPSSGWKHSHNVVHHTYTNIVGMDNDIGYGILRVTRDRKWKPSTLMQPVTNVILASLFELAVGFYDVELGRYFAKKQTWEETKPRLVETVLKVGKQWGKDYVAFPAVAAAVGLLLGKKGGRRASAKKRAKAAGQAALVANLMRNVWAYAVIFCGHFPDDVETFTKRTLDEESRGDWYLRQMLGSANFHGGKVLTLMSGNLNYQIEHHLFPDMPSNHLDEIAKEVQAIAEEYGLPYNTDSFPRQFLQVQKTLLKLSLPNSMLRAKASNAPEVRSDAAFTDNPEIAAQTGHRQLRKGLALLKKARPKILA
ncbi:fatty acid desaturase family protein [Corynebacterium variabile]|uniref:fatty acid desaturase family protein n=1 Tax=Corynebacterium variabile TaxID=1727 RepID=UPI0028AFE09A|nr:acyl-CoA desaturase [Corynebacterium variabile]